MRYSFCRMGSHESRYAIILLCIIDWITRNIKVVRTHLLSWKYEADAIPLVSIAADTCWFSMGFAPKLEKVALPVLARTRISAFRTEQQVACVPTIGRF